LGFVRGDIVQCLVGEEVIGAPVADFPLRNAEV
jgi:hypothetical protein